MNDEPIDCGHEECRQRRDDTFKLARALGFEEMHGGFAFATNDPEEAVFALRRLVGGIDGAAQDIIAQCEAMNRREALKTELNGGRTKARKVGSRHFWKGVWRWLKSGRSGS